MPEGPELHMAARFINQVSKYHKFGGQIIKSEVSTKNPDVPFNAKNYDISAETRGKELKVYLEDKKSSKNKTHILFRFGMSGCFKFTEVKDLPKHAHLRFFTVNENPQQVLSFVDYRRFGRWELEGEWGSDRGPDPIVDYENFRQNILTNLSVAAFKRPICETMLNQKYFNGVGNYLRAEILYRANIPPFTEAFTVLEPLLEDTIKSEGPDILELCNIVMKEVLTLDKGKNYDPDSEGSENNFSAWLQCYYVEGMSNLKDGNGRTMWFSGPPGPMAPKNAKTVGRKGGTGSKVPKSGSNSVKTEIKDEPSDTTPTKPHKEKKAKVKSEVKSEKDNIEVNGPKPKNKKGKTVKESESTKGNKASKQSNRKTKSKSDEDPTPSKRSKRKKSIKTKDFYSED